VFVARISDTLRISANWILAAYVGPDLIFILTVLSEDTKPVFVDCGEEHTSNYRGCKYFQSIRMKTIGHKKPFAAKSLPPQEKKLHQKNPTPPQSQDKPKSTSTSNRSFSYAQVANPSYVPRRVPTSTSSDERQPLEATNIPGLDDIISSVMKVLLPQLKRVIHQVIAGFFQSTTANE
jgi:hypothetical protein